MADEIQKKTDVHTISVLVANKPGVLVRCAQVFARRGFNIEALVVSTTVNPRYSRMTITAKGDLQTLDQIIKQTSKLIDVIHCHEHTQLDSIDREFALIKIKVNPSQKASLKKILSKNKAHIIDDRSNILIIELTGTSAELDSFEQTLKKYGILEMVRSGKLVMAKGREET